MPIFASVYPATKHQQSFLARKQRLENKKRKRAANSSEDEDAASQSSADSDPSQPTQSTTSHPVTKKDPYYIAGHLRELPLPLPPFPHAAIKEPSKKKIPIDEELASVKPPLYVPPAQPEDQSTSLKRRHLDNITTILHRCMLNGDWQRASRAWSLLLRTEIVGRGIDVRRNGRWSIGAEILMRRGAGGSQGTGGETSNGFDGTLSAGTDAGENGDNQPQFSEEGFKLAREYYERLILQYPHTPRTQHLFNATAVYPALFNIWIYEVQDRAKRARQRTTPSVSEVRRSSNNIADSDAVDDTTNSEQQQIRTEELEGAIAIANRMDELLLSPPYDTSSVLLQLRGMVAMWISDLHSTFVEPDPSTDSMHEDPSAALGANAEHHRVESRQSRQKARDIFAKLEAADVHLPPEVSGLTIDESD